MANSVDDVIQHMGWWGEQEWKGLGKQCGGQRLNALHSTASCALLHDM